MTLFGVATSLGLDAMQISTGRNKLYGIPNTTTVSIIIITVVTILYSVSAVTGVSRGIKLLSSINMVMAFGLIILLFPFYLLLPAPRPPDPSAGQGSHTGLKNFHGQIEDGSRVTRPGGSITKM